MEGSYHGAHHRICTWNDTPGQAQKFCSPGSQPAEGTLMIFASETDLCDLGCAQPFVNTKAGKNYTAKKNLSPPSSTERRIEEPSMQVPSVAECKCRSFVQSLSLQDEPPDRIPKRFHPISRQADPPSRNLLGVCSERGNSVQQGKFNFATCQAKLTKSYTNWQHVRLWTPTAREKVRGFCCTAGSGSCLIRTLKIG